MQRRWKSVKVHFKTSMCFVQNYFQQFNSLIFRKNMIVKWSRPWNKCSMPLPLPLIWNQICCIPVFSDTVNVKWPHIAKASGPRHSDKIVSSKRHLSVWVSAEWDCEPTSMLFLAGWSQNQVEPGSVWPQIVVSGYLNYDTMLKVFADTQRTEARSNINRFFNLW